MLCDAYLTRKCRVKPTLQTLSQNGELFQSENFKKWLAALILHESKNLG